MPQEIRNYLARLDWKEAQPPPVVDLHLYFEGNSEEESIAPNQWGDGRPSIAELYERFKWIAAQPNVDKVLVGLHFDWNDESTIDNFPPAENIHILSCASQSEVESWVTGLHADGVIQGWPYGKPGNAPEPPQGYTVYSVCWD